MPKGRRTMREREGQVEPRTGRSERPTGACSAPSSEHLGRCVYGGLFEPDHPTATTRRLSAATCSSSCANLRRRSCAIPAATSSPATIGRTASARSKSRPMRMDLAWLSLEPNTFGTNEFIDWCRARRHRADACRESRHARARRRSPACRVLQPPSGTQLSDLRRTARMGEAARRQVLVPRQRGGRPLADGQQDRDRVRPRRHRGGEADAPDRSHRSSSPPCGSSGRNMPTFGDWEREVLEHTFDHVEFISLHTYLNDYADDTPALPGEPRPDGQLHRGSRRDRRLRSRRSGARRSGSC